MQQRINRWLTPVPAAVAGSLLISLLFRLSGVDINNDGILYLRAADLFRDQGLEASLALYGWPFFSMLVGWLSQLGLSLLSAAWLLNVAAFALLSGSFVAVVLRLYPGLPAVHYAAVAVVLLLPELAELRNEVLRDNAAFALLIFSLLPLLRFLERPAPGLLLLWAMVVALGALFRIELALLALTVAIGLLCIPGRRRWGVALLLLVVLVGAVAVALLAHFAPESRVRDLQGWAAFYAGELGDRLADGAARLEAAVLNQYSRNYARDAMAAVLLVLLAGKLLKGLTPLYAAALWFARHRAPALRRDHRAVWLACLAGALLPPLLFVFQHFFLTQRYVFGVILLLLLLVPAALVSLLGRIHQPGLRLGVGLALLLLFSGATLRKLPLADEQLRAGQWLAEQQGSLWTNNSKVGFFSDPEFEGRPLTIDWQAGWDERLPATADADWVALLLDEAQRLALEPQLAQRGFAPVARFEGKRRAVWIWAPR